MLADTFPDWMELTADAVGRAVECTSQADSRQRGATEILFMARELRRAIRVLHRVLRDDIYAGLEPQAFVAEYTPIGKTLESMQAKLDGLLARLPSRPTTRLQRVLLNLTRTSEREVFEMRRTLTKYLEAAQKPLPPVHTEGLRRSREDAGSGRTENVIDVLCRLVAGGEL